MAVAEAATPRQVPARRFVAMLALGQLISWGTLFYAITFLAAPISRDEGWSREHLFGAFSLALLVAGLSSLRVAKTLARWGLRRVLTAASVGAGIAFAMLALAHGPWLFAIGWALAGVTMSVLLYEGAFAALRERADLDFRRAVATITVVGGLASTVFWPLTRGLVEWVGWRGTAAAFALLHLAVVAPLHAIALRSLGRSAPTRSAPEARVERPASHLGSRVRWLAASFALAAFVSGALAAHLDSLFTELGVGAVWVMAAAVSFGPLQTAGRVLDLMLDGRWSWRSLGVVLLGVQTLALASLFALPLAAWLAVPFAASFGAANGLLTLVRPLSVADGRPLEDRADFASALFAVSSASLFARALAPLTVASAMRLWGVQGVLIGFVLLSATAWLAFRRALTSSM